MLHLNYGNSNKSLGWLVSKSSNLVFSLSVLSSLTSYFYVNCSHMWDWGVGWFLLWEEKKYEKFFVINWLRVSLIQEIEMISEIYFEGGFLWVGICEYGIH